MDLRIFYAAAVLPHASVPATVSQRLLGGMINASLVCAVCALVPLPPPSAGSVRKALRPAWASSSDSAKVVTRKSVSASRRWPATSGGQSSVIGSLVFFERYTELARKRLGQPAQHGRELGIQHVIIIPQIVTFFGYIFLH